MTTASSARLASARPPIALLGVPFDNVTTTEAIELIEQMVGSRRPHYLVTANVDFLVQAQRDIELRRILLEAHLVLCDGTPLVWASRWLGNPLPERVAGADLVPLLIRVAAQKGYRLFFLGATPQSAARAVKRLRLQHPELLIAGHYSPPFSHLLEMDHDEIARRILAAQPDVLFVSLGCPKQEKWLAMHYRHLGVPVAAGVGATIDFLAGEVKRAPRWLQRMGGEWLFRLAQEPRRLGGRYATDLWVFAWSLLAQWWHLRRRPLTGARMPRPRVANDEKRADVASAHLCRRVHLPERLDLAAVRACAALVEQALADDRHCLLELAQVTFIDSTGIGLLIRWQKEIRAAGRHLVLLAPSPAVWRALALLRLEDVFLSAPDEAAALRLLQLREREQANVVTLPAPAPAGPLLWRGEITAANAKEVWTLTAAHLASLPPLGQWILDLSAVRFIDSSGLGLMLRAKKLARERGATLLFHNPQPAVRNVLQLARLEEFLLDEAA